jgi:hypothetical protein
VLSACLGLQLLDKSLVIAGLSSGTRIVMLGLALVVAVAAISLGQYGLSGFAPRPSCPRCTRLGGTGNGERAALLRTSGFVQPTTGAPDEILHRGR